MATNPLRCADCGREVAEAVTKQTTASPGGRTSLLDANVERTVEFWWCRDCMQGICNKCHLMKGHTEHRTNEWKKEEIYRACVQALEGRCSRRNKIIHDQKIAIKEFVAKVEVTLLNELARHLEQNNDPDRKMIARINRALTTAEMTDERPNLYHLPSPSRPAWKIWNLDTEDPAKMAELVEQTSELLQLPREEYYEEELHLNEKSEWNPRRAAELIAHTMGARISLDTQSNYSRSMTPERSFAPSAASVHNGDDSRRRAGSVDSHRRAMPLEPSVFVRAGPSVMSFRERSVPSDETATFADSVGSPVLSHVSFDSKPGSAMSSIPAFPCDQSLASMTPSQSQAVTPTPILNGSLSNGQHSPRRQKAFGSKFLTRPICVQSFSTGTHREKLAVSDSCGGVYITNPSGEIEEHVQIKNSSASSVAIDEKNNILYVSVMQAKGRSIHMFDIAAKFKKLDVLQCPKDPKIEMSRTRWITVAPRGQLYMVSGDNVKSALWCYVRGRKGWKTIKESRKTRYQYLSVAEDQAEYKAVVLLTCDAANNRLLLFVVDHSLSLINEYDLSKTYRLPDHISSPASAIVDVHGNLLILDYASGKVWILLSGVKGIRRLKEIHFDEPVLPQEALGITVMTEDVYVACFGQREVRHSRYLENGVFINSPPNRSPSLGRRSASVPRPPESVV